MITEWEIINYNVQSGRTAMIDHRTSRVLDLFDGNHLNFESWTEDKSEKMVTLIWWIW